MPEKNVATKLEVGARVKALVAGLPLAKEYEAI